VRFFGTAAFLALALGLAAAGIQTGKLSRRLRAAEAMCRDAEELDLAVDRSSGPGEPVPAARPRSGTTAPAPRALRASLAPSGPASDDLRQCLLGRDAVWSRSDSLLMLISDYANLPNPDDKVRLQDLVKKLQQGRREVLDRLGRGQRDGRTASREMDELTREFLAGAYEILKPTASDN
jgi:hypothetical protein